jgi:transcriptional regulator with XRE-family HTH domain
MRRNEAAFASPPMLDVARHFAALVKQARLARGWTQAELAERARISAPTMHRLEQGAIESSLGAWLAVFERLGLLPRLAEISDPVSKALLDETRPKRPRRKTSAPDLDF